MALDQTPTKPTFGYKIMKIEVAGEHYAFVQLETRAAKGRNKFSTCIS
jgi:hypothetical protein